MCRAHPVFAPLRTAPQRGVNDPSHPALPPPVLGDAQKELMDDEKRERLLQVLEVARGGLASNRETGARGARLRASPHEAGGWAVCWV